MEIRNTTLDDVAAVIGFSATLRLAAWFGDEKSLYVPHTLTEQHALSKLIGFSAARRLSEAWGGERLALPRLRAYEDDLLRRMVGRMLERTFSYREVAVHMRISERRVQQIARELELGGLMEVVTPKKAVKKPAEKRAFKSVWDGLLTECSDSLVEEQD